MTPSHIKMNDSKGSHSPVMTTTPLDSLRLCSGRSVEKPREAVSRGATIKGA